MGATPSAPRLGEDKYMTEEYKKRLIELAKDVLKYRETTDSKDYTFLAKLDYLIGYIMALDEKGKK